MHSTFQPVLLTIATSLVFGLHATAQCVDVADPNDTCATAVPVTPGTLSNLFVGWPDSDDYFSITIAPGEQVLAEQRWNWGWDEYLGLELYIDGTCTTPEDADLFGAGFTRVRWLNTTPNPVEVILRSLDHADFCIGYDLVVELTPDFIAQSFCAGDFTFGNCPCNNEATFDSGDGCQNSQGHGALLTPNGSASHAADDLSFTVTGARPWQPALLLQSSSIISSNFTDGILCMGTALVRMEVIFLDAAGSGTSSGSIVTRGSIPGPGATRYYQLWYRDPGGVSPCGTGSNLSQALIVDWL